MIPTLSSGTSMQFLPCMMISEVITRATMFLGSGAVIYAPTKQKVNTRSSTEKQSGIDWTCWLYCSSYLDQISLGCTEIGRQGYDNLPGQYVDNQTYRECTCKCGKTVSSFEYQIFLPSQYVTLTSKASPCQVSPHWRKSSWLHVPSHIDRSEILSWSEIIDEPTQHRHCLVHRSVPAQGQTFADATARWL
jgi:hypothetical protein